MLKNNGMKNMIEKSIIFAASKPSKSLNEDCCAFYSGNKFSAIAIADGVGSSSFSYLASKLAVEEFIKKIKEYDEHNNKIDEMGVVSIYNEISKKIEIECVKLKEQKKLNNIQNMMQTTLITLVETDDRYILNYIGNGSIWYIRGDFWKFDLTKRIWPWCITDLMLGHSIPNAEGKEVLEGYIGPEFNPENYIQCMSVFKNKKYGEIFVLTTDGISSSDHLIIGIDNNNKVWIEINIYIQNLLERYLIKFFHDFKESKTGNISLRSYIEKFLNDNTFNDDATLGLLISPKVIESYLNVNADHY
jgi:serine/threonine protein phosphatase PrpC